MTTIVELDDALRDEALRLTGLESPQNLLALALAELVARRRRKDLLDLAGQIKFSDDFDHKALRALRHGSC
jgi:Arc/MetJ family transcription regulator